MRLLGRRLGINVPSRKDKDSRVATQGTGNDLRTLDTEIHAVILDRRDRGLRYSSPAGQFILAEFLQFPNDPN
jgi:hypothetical protein